MQQVLVVKTNNPRYSDYIQNINELLKAGWIIESQICASVENYAIFSYIMSYNKNKEQ